MADPIDPDKSSEAMKKLIEQLDSVNPAFASLIKQSLGLETAYKKQQKDIEQQQKTVKEGIKDLKELNKSYNENKKTYGQTLSDLNSLSQTFDSLSEEVRNSKTGMQMYQRINQVGSKLMWDTVNKGAVSAMGNLAANIGSAYMANLKAGIRGLQSDASATQVAADLVTTGIDSAQKAVSGLAGVAKGVGGALGAIPHPAAQVAGALIGVVSDIIDASAKQAAEIAKFATEVVSKELEKTVKSFNQASSAGALFANGLTGLRESATRAGLTQDQYSKIIAENSEALANFGGSVADGAKKLGAVTGNFSDGTRRNLLKLGISVEEQAQGTADYMSMLQQTGQLRGKSDQQLAAESANYMVNLKALSAFTGEDVKAAAKRAKEAAMQGAVRAKLESMGGEANLKFQNAIKGMPADMQKAAQQMLVSGTISDPELAAAMASMPGAMEMLKRSVNDVTDANVSANDAIDRHQANVKELGPAMKAEAKGVMESAGVAALHGGSGVVSAMTSVAGGIMTLSEKAAQQGEKSTREQAEAAANTQDALTNGVTESTAALQNLKLQIQDQLTPAITQFAEMVPSILKGLKAQLDQINEVMDKQSGRADERQRQVNEELMNQGFLNPATGGATGMDFGMMGAADGGVFEGPDSGFPVLLHGREAVVPMDKLTNAKKLGNFSEMGGLSGMMQSIKSPSMEPINAGSLLGSGADPISKMMDGMASLFGMKDEAVASTSISTSGSSPIEEFIDEFKNAHREQLEKQSEMIKIISDHKSVTEQLMFNMS